MVLVDAVVAPAAGRARERGVERARELLRRARARRRVPALHATCGVPRLDACPTCCSRATTGGSTSGGASRAGSGASAGEEPDRAADGLPHAWTVALDWVVTIVGAVAIVLAIKAWVVNPYRIPTSSMEPTLHCAAPGPGCLAAVLRPRAREPLHLPLHGARARRHRRLQHAAARGAAVPRRQARSSSGSSPCPGRPGEQRDGIVYINGRRLDEPYIPHGAPGLRDVRAAEDPRRRVLRDGRQPHASRATRGAGARCRAGT